MTRPTPGALAALASTLIAVVVGYHAVRNRHELRTMLWALTGHPKSQADPRVWSEPWMVNGVLCNCEPKDFKHHPNCDTNLPLEKRSGPRIR